MKCFTLKSLTYTSSGVTPMGTGPRVTFVQDNYPSAQEGIQLTSTDLCLVVGGEIRIPASDELLTLPPESGAIIRSGTRVTVLRASIERKPDGSLLLIPERQEDAGKALVYIDIGGASYGNLRFQEDGEQILARVASDELRMHDEKVLAVLEPFKPLLAVRSSRKYMFWGEERVRERLPLQFDGRTLFYNIDRA